MTKTQLATALVAVFALVFLAGCSNEGTAYNNSGLAKAKLGKYREAIVDYDQAIELDPEYAKAYHNRGNAKYHLGKYREALVNYNQAIELDPKNTEIYYQRDRIKAFLDNYK